MRAGESGAGSESGAADGDGGVTLRAVADATGGKMEGDGGFRVAALGSLENAGGDTLAFYADSKQEAALKTTAAGAVLLRAGHAGLFAGPKVIVDNPYLAYARASALFAPTASATGSEGGVHPSAIIDAGASVDAGAVVGPYCVIGRDTTLAAGVVLAGHVWVGERCAIGRNTRIDAGVRIYPRTVIGARCNIASGVVLGGGGFGYAEDRAANDDARWVRIEQLGGVRIGDDVDIGANTTIDRGALDNTVIGNGVKLDNLIQIAHNVRVGDGAIMAGCVAIAGSATIGRRCQLGGRASILGHLTIADDVRINADSFVASSITEAGAYSSMLPVQPAARWRKTLAHLRRLEQLAEKLKALGKTAGRGNKPNKRAG